MKKKLTDKSILKLRTDDPRGLQVRDAGKGAVEGFGCTVYPTGKLVFWLAYTRPSGRGERRYKLGVAGIDKTVDEYRDEAKVIVGRVQAGEDPAAERQRRREGITFAAWADEYLAGVKLRKKAPRHDLDYLARAKARWPSDLLAELTASDVESFVKKVGEEHKTTANRLLASIRACFAAAWRLDLIPSNPAAKVRLFPEGEPRSRVLTDDELHRVLTVVESWKHEHERAAFLLLIHTGARLSEVLRARWSDMDLDAAQWMIPSPKAGKKQTVPLPAGMVAMLRRLKRVGVLVIPGASNPDRPRFDLKGPWDAIRLAAKVEDVHVHDLRRSYGLRIARAAGLHVASKLLRHGDVRVTERVYVPLGLDDLRPATEQHSGQLAKVLKMKPRKKAV